ncbi:MAG: DUF2478 domain-containing protein [Ancalomicrobiaceae bacterium]|nr:DUF2478 domain-containing protein [Ancalomicrobiaceae bacterium]
MDAEGSYGSAGTSSDMLNAFEIAALVYDDGVSVDDLIGYFAGELRAGGSRIGGVIQLPPQEQGQKSEILRVYDLMSGETFPIKQQLGAGSTACSLDTRALADASMRIRRAVDSGVDLLFISRFGKQEAAGAGFRDEFGYAVASGVPVITSVRRVLVPEWLTFTGGIGTLLACRLKVLTEWWTETESRRKKLLAAREAEAALLRRRTAPAASPTATENVVRLSDYIG